MRLHSLIKSVRLCLPANTGDFQVRGITADSRKVKTGFIFVAVKGGDFDGHRFIPEAIRKGAKVIIAQAVNPRSRDASDEIKRKVI